MIKGSDFCLPMGHLILFLGYGFFIDFLESTARRYRVVIFVYLWATCHLILIFSLNPHSSFVCCWG